MKKSIFLAAAAFSGMLFAANDVNAQDAIVVEEDVTVAELTPCKDYYDLSSGNWYIQVGAGINAPFVESYLANGDEKTHLTAAYNLAVGKWMTPYLGWRLSALGGAYHWDNHVFSKAKYANLNFDLMWDMFNSFGVDNERAFSIVPFVGIGGTFCWDFSRVASSVFDNDGKVKSNSWTLPVSAGIQFRLRLNKYVDFFVEGRAQMYGDNFNNTAYGDPVDVNVTALGGFTFRFGEKNFNTVDPCTYLAQIDALNNQVNDLRGALANCNNRLAAAEAQLPCPEVKCPECPEAQPASLMSNVQFTLNSAKVRNSQMINVYSVAKWMNENPNAKVVVKGYADKNTGSSSYNMSLSEKRAQNVYKLLVDKYGIAADRLTVVAEGSDSQVYDENNWNRVVVFVAE